ncbi:unnamed protein product [Meloidogyne enterolobii]|uniref:Uncharacterized protein n=1 Tax=Meloidogyne enterolobii TaxID=390850 RepID=A0ACB0Y3I1_MELEN
MGFFLFFIIYLRLKFLDSPTLILLYQLMVDRLIKQNSPPPPSSLLSWTNFFLSSPPPLHLLEP